MKQFFMNNHRMVLAFTYPLQKPEKTLFKSFHNYLWNYFEVKLFILHFSSYTSSIRNQFSISNQV